MYAVPLAYEEAITAGTRDIELFISIGHGIDTTARDDLSVEGTFLPMSNPDQLTNAVYSMTPGLATFEYRGIPTANSAGMIAPPIQPTAYPPEVGVWSDVISDGQGNIVYSMALAFAAEHTSALSFYFDEVYPVDFNVKYKLGGLQVAVVNVSSNKKKVWMTEQIVTYDRIELDIMKMSRGFSHFRMPEVEFGASVSFSRDKLSGTIRYIEEYDPLGMSSPISQLTFSLINVGGRFDDDNPDLAVELSRSIPITASVTVYYDDGEQLTVPVGLFYIREQLGPGTKINITAQDTRALLQDKRPNLTILTNKSLGAYIDDMLNAYAIRHIVDPMMFTVYADQAVTLDPDMDALSMLIHMKQYADVKMWVDREGTLRIGPKPTDDYGVIPANMELSWPAPDTRATVYNMIEVLYAANSVYTLDLRESDSEVRLVLNVDNPMIITSAKAQLVAARIAQNILKTNRKRTEWRGDPVVNAGDTFQAVTRFNDSDEVLPQMICTRIENEYTKGLRSIIQGVHQ